MCDYLNEAGAAGAVPCKLDFDREYIRRRGIGARAERENSRRRQRSTGCSQPDWLVELSVPFAEETRSSKNESRVTLRYRQPLRMQAKEPTG